MKHLGSAISATFLLLAGGAQTAPLPPPRAVQLQRQSPGLGNAVWHPLDSTEDMVEYFTTAGIHRNGNLAEGWFTDVFPDARDLGPGLSGIQFGQTLVAADCTHGSTKLVRVAAYDSEEKVLTEADSPDQSFERAGPGIPTDQLAVICGTRNLAGDKTFSGDGRYLLELTRKLLQMRKQDDAKQH